MAVLAPEGVCEIVFEFETPGLKVGIIITLITVVLIAVYLGAVRIKRSIRPTPPPGYPEGDVISEHIRLYEAANYAAENPDDDYLLDNLEGLNIDAYSGFNGGFVIDDSAVEDFETGNIPVIDTSDLPENNESNKP